MVMCATLIAAFATPVSEAVEMTVSLSLAFLTYSVSRAALQLCSSCCSTDRAGKRQERFSCPRYDSLSYSTAADVQLVADIYANV